MQCGATYYVIKNESSVYPYNQWAIMKVPSGYRSRDKSVWRTFYWSFNQKFFLLNFLKPADYLTSQQISVNLIRRWALRYLLIFSPENIEKSSILSVIIKLSECGSSVLCNTCYNVLLKYYATFNFRKTQNMFET